MAIKEINVSKITDAVKKLCMEANYYLPEDVVKALKQGYENEESEAGKAVFKQIFKNIEIAGNEKVALCQDTGLAVIFMEIGQDVHFIGGNLIDAVNEGVRQGYTEGYLRKSVVAGLKRVNTKDNTPCVLHTHIVPGDRVKITVCPKGGGSENMSTVKMMKPADGIEGVKKFVLEKVVEAGPNPCPPIVIGIGMGGSFEYCAYLAKKALLREIGSPNPDPELDKLEKEILELVNKTGIGPQGLGGRITALGVFIEMAPCHIASYPVAINMNCHVARHKETVI